MRQLSLIRMLQLAAAAAFEGLQSSARKYGQISPAVGHCATYATSAVLQPAWSDPNRREKAAMPDTLGLFAGKACNHRPKVKAQPPRCSTACALTRGAVCIDTSGRLRCCPAAVSAVVAEGSDAALTSSPILKGFLHSAQRWTAGAKGRRSYAGKSSVNAPQPKAVRSHPPQPCRASATAPRRLPPNCARLLPAFAPSLFPPFQPSAFSL